MLRPYKLDRRFAQIQPYATNQRVVGTGSTGLQPVPMFFSTVSGISMNLFELTRALVDIESVTEDEKQVGVFLFDRLRELAARHSGQVERMEADRDRFNVFARWGEPVVTLSTHMDTVPPFFPSREDAEHIWGRGACDAKGILAAMMAAAEKLLGKGVRNFAL